MAVVAQSLIPMVRGKRGTLTTKRVEMVEHAVNVLLVPGDRRPL